MQTQKGRTTSEAPKKAHPQGVRHLKTTGLDSNSSSSSGQVRTPKERSPKIVDRRSPKSPVTEKKRPSRISELESRVSQLTEELKKAKDQLTLSESSKNEALQDAEKSKNELITISSKLEEVQNKLVEQSNLEPIEESLPSENGELEKLKSELMETRSLVENMKIQLTDSKNSEAEAQALARETLHQLETAKKSVEALRSDGSKSIEAYNSVVAELEQSKARIKELEALVNGANDLYPIARNGTTEDGNRVEDEVYSLKSEVERLRSALDFSEKKYNEEQTHNALQVRSAYELVEQIKSDSLIREAELEAELKRMKSEVEELKADLMDKETELQGISEENDDLNMKLRKKSSSHGESELEIQLTKMKASLTEKETQLKNITEENESLKSHMRKETNSENTAELETLRAAEREAAAKLGLLMEEADRSSKRAARLTEQLEASQAANAEMEADLRRMKVQSDQWRKAAEAAAAMITAGNNGKFVESGFEPVAEKMGLPYSEDLESEMMRKRNGNMLKKIGVLWKKA